MNAITVFIAELEKAKTFEFDRIEGYSELTGIPATLLHDETRVKVIEAADWSRQRNQLLSNAIDALSKLAEHKYPDRPKKVTSSDIIAELTELERLFDLAVDEFTPDPVSAVKGTSKIEVKPVMNTTL